MKYLLATLFLIGLNSQCIAQKSPFKFGDIPLEDLTMTTYDKDSSATAIILADFGKISFAFPTFIYERHLRVKILKPEGMRWADGIIPFQYTRSEAANQLTFKASTYNLENGKTTETKLTSDAMFSEKVTRDYKVKKFTFPNAKVGSVLEYSYSLKMGGIPAWEFQEAIPIRLSEFWAVIPTDLTIKNYSQGYIKATTYEVKESAASNVYHWIFNNVPAFRSEPLMACEEDFRGKINFYLTHANFGGISREFMSSWEKVNDELLKSREFGETVKGSFFLKELTESTIAKTTSPIEKLQKIYDYVQGHYEWNNNNSLFSMNLNDAFEKQTGSSGDINLTLASMLQKAGLKVNLVLLSTRENGLVRKEIPLFYQFNYVICAVTLDNRIILMDATEKHLPLGYLPPRCINGDGFMLDESGYRWVPTDFLPITKTTVSATFTLGDESTSGEISFVRNGYDALDFRKTYAEVGEEKYVQEVLKENEWELVKSEFENLDALGEATKEKYSFTTDKLALKLNDIIYIDGLVEGKLKENPFTQNDRMYPINFKHTMEVLYIGKIIFPDHFVVDELPRSIILSLEDRSARFTYSVTHIGNTVTVYSNFKIDKSLFVQTEYLQLKEFYNQVIAKQAEQIVLKRK